MLVQRVASLAPMCLLVGYIGCTTTSKNAALSNLVVSAASVVSSAPSSQIKGAPLENVAALALRRRFFNVCNVTQGACHV